MTKLGILVHCRHLETVAWEDLVFGIPAEDKLGDLAMLAMVILRLEPTEQVECIIIGRGPSWRDGLNEGEYTKKFWLNNLDRLHEFPRLQPLLDTLSDEQLAKFHALLKDIVITPEIRNTVTEIEAAAKIFTEKEVRKVVQICAASHAARCIKEQTVARSHGTIAKNQLWQTVATDMSYHDTRPEDVAVIEPLHRRDQPMMFMRPGLSEIISQYYHIPDPDKQEFVKLVKDFMDKRK